MYSIFVTFVNLSLFPWKAYAKRVYKSSLTTVTRVVIIWEPISCWPPFPCSVIIWIHIHLHTKPDDKLCCFSLGNFEIVLGQSALPLHVWSKLSTYKQKPDSFQLLWPFAHRLCIFMCRYLFIQITQIVYDPVSTSVLRITFGYIYNGTSQCH